MRLGRNCCQGMNRKKKDLLERSNYRGELRADLFVRRDGRGEMRVSEEFSSDLRDSCKLMFGILLPLFLQWRHVMASESEFHPGFFKLISDAFTLIPNLTSGRIYNMYGGAGPVTNFNEGVLDAFLNNLIVIKNQSANVMQIEVQGYPANNNWGHLTQAFIAGLSTANKEEIWDTFYHFRRTTTPALKRLYIHAKAPIETNGLEIFRRLLQVPNVPGFSNVKIGGPGCTDRADTIVAYFSNKESLQAVIDALQKSDFNPAWFEDGIPTGTLPLSFLKKLGVAGADDVPSLNVQGIDTSSYGMFLSTVIYESYVQIYTPWANGHAGALIAVKKEKFLEAVLQGCAFLKVDAKTIYLTQQEYKKLDISDEQVAREIAAQARLNPI